MKMCRFCQWKNIRHSW